jgi:high-affinity iron transporter
MLREGFEATLVVGILFAYLRRIDRNDLRPAVWFGVGAATAIAIAVGVIVHVTTGDLTGAPRMRTFAIISLAAAAVLTWMIFWMARQARAIKGELEHKVDAALSSTSAGRGVLLVAFAAVLREGIEAALFLIAASIDSNGGQVIVGSIIGLAIAAALGYAIYAGGRTIPMRTFFRVTGVVLIVFAAGLCAKAVQFLQASGDLGTVNNALYNLTSIHWLTIDSEIGKFLSALFGWDPRPSLEQVVAWAVYLVPVVVFFLWGDQIANRLRRSPRTANEPATGKRSEVPQRVTA